MAGSRKGGDSHEGPRAIPENRWEESAEAERRQDALVEEELERDAQPETDETGSDLTGALERGTRRVHENSEDQARVGPRSVKDPEQPV
jgi:hypothetical protein